MSLFGSLFGSSKNTNSYDQAMAFANAANAMAAEAQRQANISTGNNAINKAFSGFDDGFYNGLRDNYLGYYQPQLNDQFGQARNDLTYKLARAGTLNSSAAEDLQTRLARQNMDAQAQIQSKADSAAASLKDRVAQEKSAAQQQLTATNDPSLAANMALNSSTALKATPMETSPLGSLFTVGTIGAANVINGYNNPGSYGGYAGGAYSGPSLFQPAGSSTRVIGS